MLQEYPPLSPQHTHNWCAGTGLHWLLREDCEIFRTYVGSLISVVRGVWKPANIINQHFSFPEKPVLNINQHTYVHTHIHTYTHRVKFVWFGVKKKTNDSYPIVYFSVKLWIKYSWKIKAGQKMNVLQKIYKLVLEHIVLDFLFNWKHVQWKWITGLSA